MTETHAETVSATESSARPSAGQEPAASPAPGSIAAHPHVREFLADTLTPLGVFRRLQDLSPYRFLFESVTGGEQVSRFSFAGAAPSEVLWLYQDRLLVASAPDLGAVRTLRGDPLALMSARLEAVRTVRAPLAGTDLPFVGGWVGYFGWDLSRLLERLPSPPADDYGLPIALLARYDAIAVLDHARQRIVLVSNEVEGQVSRAQAMERLEQWTEALEGSEAAGALALPSIEPPLPDLAPPSLSDDQYRAVVEKAKEFIRAGDIFQVVPARRWELREHIAPLALYRSLRLVNPSPYMVLVESPEVSLVGGSPEVLVRVHGDNFAVRPIAGTRRRGANSEEDRALEQEMLQDPKEIAEHVMLVDLGRNDLGRVSLPGQVRVTSFLQVERYSHVMHIVSQVEGTRAPGRSALDALFACFPAGTLSGAPKIRAMEIIDELEPVGRGPYGGAVGYLSFNGDLDTCITIRTLVVQPDRTTVSAGAGLVADSDPESEQQETKDKAAALLRAVALAQHLGRTHPDSLTMVESVANQRAGDAEISSAETSSTEISSAETSSTEISSTEISSTEISSTATSSDDDREQTSERGSRVSPAIGKGPR